MSGNVVVFSQQNDSLQQILEYPFVVDSISISGNEITEDFIITRELTFGLNDTLTSSIASFNRERIYSLGIFNQIYFLPVKANGKNILEIKVEESWYIYPIPFLNISENDLKKISYGLYLRLKNFRGKNEDITTSFSFGYDPSLNLSYYTPNLIGKKNYFFKYRLGYSKISNKSLAAEKIYGSPFSQKLIYTQIFFGKRINLFNKVYLAAGFNNIETDKYIPGINASDGRVDNVLDLGLGYEYDTRDLAQFPKNGIYTSALFTQRGLGLDEINYGVAWLDFREYRKIFGNLISKWRFASRLTLGKNIPYYDHSILGAGDKIRGHYFRKYEGNDYYVGSLELFYPLIEELKIDLTFLPIIPDQLLSYRVAFYTQLFAETGLAKYHDESFALNKFNTGFGIGFTLLVLPYQIFRLEFAFDEKLKSEFILNFGISFWHRALLQ